MTKVATVSVGNRPIVIAVSPNGARAYVANYAGNSVSVIDTASNSVVATVPVGNGLHGVTVSPNGARVYVSNIISGGVSVIDTATNTVIDTTTATTTIVTTVAVGTGPVGLSVRPDGSRLYVTNAGDGSVAGTVSVIDTGSNTIVATVGVGRNPQVVENFIGLVPPAIPVPTLSQWAMILLWLILAGGAAVMIHHRRGPDPLM